MNDLWKVRPKTGGIFLRIKAGENAKGLLYGDPKTFRVKWVNGKPQPEEGEDTRFKINFVIVIYR